MKQLTFIFASIIVLASSCKRDNDGLPPALIKTPAITGVSSNFVQAGDTITVYGTELQQDTLQTDLALSGRPAKIIQLGKDSLQAIVPANTHSGKLMVTVSLANQYISAYGPELAVAPSPALLRYWPLYAMPGDTVSLMVENFAPQLSDNYVALGDQPARIIYSNGRDTMKIIIPEGAVTGQLRWRTYKGPLYSFAGNFPVRQLSYQASTILEWLQQDPAYSFMHAAFVYDPVKTRPGYDLLLSYLDGTNPCAIFLPVNDGWYAEGLLDDATFINARVRGAPYNFVNFPLASLLPGAVAPDQLTAGPHVTALNEKIVYNDPRRGDAKNSIELQEQGGDWHIRALAYWGPMHPFIRVRRVHKIGNSYLYEIETALPYDSEYY